MAGRLGRVRIDLAAGTRMNADINSDNQAIGVGPFLIRVYPRLSDFSHVLSNRPTINNHNFAIHETVAIANHERGILSELFRAAKSTG